VHSSGSVGQADAYTKLQLESSGGWGMQGHGPPMGQHMQLTSPVHTFKKQVAPQPPPSSNGPHVISSETGGREPGGHSPPPLPSQVTGHSPRAPALMHCPRSRPGPYVCLQHLTHSRLPPLSAQATPGIEAKAPPTKAAPSNLSALPLERVPLATSFANSSKESSAVERSWCEWLALCSSSAIDAIPFCFAPKQSCSPMSQSEQ
jgi:hypothetical protein